jgi:hypothetical protein
MPGGSACTGASETCANSPFANDGVCATLCLSGKDADCPKGKVCVTGIGRAACLTPCTSPAECGGGTTCGALFGKTACAPPSWKIGLGKGIGQACATDAECDSRSCRGFCTTPCTNDTTDCVNKHAATGLNDLGSLNFCVASGPGAGTCAASGCTPGDAKCEVYGVSSCVIAPNPVGTRFGACLPR